jgi:hypothetical protein
MNLLGRLVLVASVVVIAFGCTAEKSENWLAPTVAGPIPGITITAPNPIDPGSGARVPSDRQPITLVVGNASSNGPRPLSYAFEIATDTNFTTKVFTRDGISGGSGRTSLRLPDALATGRTYFWRAQAQDGANSSAFSTPVSFSVFTPVVIGAPPLGTPANNEKVASRRPTFTFGNAPRTGPAGAISYEVEVAENDAFAGRFAGWVVGETAGVISAQLPLDGPFGKYFFWHVRAFDSANSGPWSETRAFVMPDAPPPTGGGGGGGAPTGPPCPSGPKTPEQVVACVAAQYPGQQTAVSTDAQRFAQIAFLKARIIETGLASGLDMGCHTRPNGAVSGDIISWRHGGVTEIFDFVPTNPPHLPIHLFWLGPIFNEWTTPPYGYTAYPSPTCN